MSDRERQARHNPQQHSWPRAEAIDAIRPGHDHGDDQEGKNGVMDEGARGGADAPCGTRHAKQQRRDDKADETGEGDNVDDRAVPSHEELGAPRQHVKERIRKSERAETADVECLTPQTRAREGAA